MTIKAVVVITGADGDGGGPYLMCKVFDPTNAGGTGNTVNVYVNGLLPEEINAVIASAARDIALSNWYVTFGVGDAVQILNPLDGRHLY